MTDDEIRDIFVELKRIGVDLEQPPGLALGTGFRDGEFLVWLRALPTALGHDAFVDQLNAHVDAVAPSPPRASSRPAEPTQPLSFECATLEQLEAAIDILTQEWDPLGARIGQPSREELSEHAFGLMNAILGLSGADVEKRVAKMIGSLEEHEFGVRPSPVQQRRYLARRLMQVVVDHPSPPAEPETMHATARSNRVSLGPRGDELPPLDPTAICAQCGTTGTVAVVMRDREPAVSRFCIDCWHGVRDKYHKLPPPMDTSTPQGMIAVFEHVQSAMRERVRYTASALWEDSLDFLRASIASSGDETAAIHEHHLQELASELLERAPKMHGRMPPDIEAFVREHAPPSA